MNAQSSSQIRSLFLDGPAGRLEALLNAGTADATYAALVCHPHPSFGGTLHNKVVFHTMKTLNSFGFPVLRFNFRSAGLSQGEHDHGRGEVDDVRSALDWLDKEFRLPMIFAGFSFGAAVGGNTASRRRAGSAACAGTNCPATDTNAYSARRHEPIGESLVHWIKVSPWKRACSSSIGPPAPNTSYGA